MGEDEEVEGLESELFELQNQLRMQMLLENELTVPPPPPPPLLMVLCRAIQPSTPSPFRYQAR